MMQNKKKNIQEIITMYIVNIKRFNGQRIPNVCA